MNDIPVFRKLLRDVVAEKLGHLESFAGRAGPNVYVMRGPVLRRDMLPAVRIYTLSDTRTNRSESHDTGVFDGALTLRLQIIVEDNPADPKVADRLDWLCWLAETALLSDPAVRRDLKFVITSIDTTIDLDVQGEMRTAIATMDYALRYADCFELVLVDQLRKLHFQLDFIDPAADPNTGPPGTPPNVEGGYVGGYPGPDGRIEYRFEANYEEDHAGDDATARSAVEDD